MNRVKDFLTKKASLAKEESGLTLVEMVIAVVIFGLLTTLVFNLFSTSRDTTENVQDGSTSIAQAQTATSQLAKKLRNAVAYKVTAEGNRLDIENSDGTCTTWAYNDGVLYYHDKGKADKFSTSWMKKLPEASIVEGSRFFTPVVGGVTYSFKSGSGVGAKKIEGSTYMRLPSKSTSSECFGDDPATTTPTPAPTPTPTPIPVYNITYELAGGLATGNPSTYTSKYAAFSLNNPSREGYTFAGWTGTGISGSSTAVTVDAGSSGERNYTATWAPKSYNITYDLSGGAVSGNPLSYTIETGNFTLKNPTRSGYNFAGWMGTEISGTSNSVTVNTGSTGDRSYVATWVGAPTPTPPPSPTSQFEGKATKKGGWDGNIQFDFSYLNKSGASINSVLMKIKVPGATGFNSGNVNCSYQGSNTFLCQTPTWSSVGNGSWSGTYFAQFTGPTLNGGSNPAVEFISITKNS